MTQPPLSATEAAEDRLFDGMARPWASRALTAVIVLVHGAVSARILAQSEAGLLVALGKERGPLLLRRAGAMWAPAVDQGELWRLLTSVFVHGSGLHLLLNAMALLGVGPLVEGIYGPVRLWWVFVAGGVFGAALSWVAGIPLTEGASGGIFALLGAAFTFAFRHGADLPADLRRSLRLRLALWIAFNFGVGLFVPFVNNVAHAGGLAVGLILGMTMDSAAATGQPPDRRSSAALVGLMGGLGAWGLWGISTKW